MRRRVTVVGSVCVCVCVSVCLLSHISPLEHLFVLKILSRTQKVCGFFSETTLLQEIQHCSVESKRMVRHFPAESAHAHCIACAFSRFAHAWRQGFCTLVHSCCDVRCVRIISEKMISTFCPVFSIFFFLKTHIS